LSQDSNVTPPVALAAFTAAAIAKSPAMATGVTSWKLAKGIYIVPIIMAYTPILSGDWALALMVFLFSAVGIYGLAGALQGCLERPIGLALRAVVGVAGIACLWPGSLAVNLAGLAFVLGLLALNVSSARKLADVVAE
ncbi:MAG: TRAP transporter permease, partial [Boseongicola sp.]